MRIFGADPDLQFVDLFYCEHTHPPTRPQYCRSHSWSRPTAGLVQFLVRQRTAISNSWAHPTAGFVQILVLQQVLGACSRPPAPHRASPSGMQPWARLAVGSMPSVLHLEAASSAVSYPSGYPGITGDGVQPDSGN